MIKRTGLLLSLLLLVGTFAGCRTPSTGIESSPKEIQPGEVKFDLIGPNDAFIIVPVQINGKGPYSFILDTGATMTCVDDKLAEQLQLPGDSGTSGVVSGVRGPAKVRLIKIESFQVGSAKATDLPACSISLEHIQKMGVKTEGMIGLNFLKQYRMILNFDRDTLLLEEPLKSDGTLDLKRPTFGQMLASD